MTGHTHKQYSITFAFLVAMFLHAKGLTQINYYLCLPIIIQISKYGALFPDVDPHWDNVKDKTVPNRIINTLIRITGGKHRSWQTHSIDIVAIGVLFSIFLPEILLAYEKITVVNKEVLSIVMISFFSGWVSHILADMMTSGGVRVVCFSKQKIRLVPRRIGKLKFNTGNEWEEFVFKSVKIINLLLGTICVIYPFIYSGKLLHLIDIIKTFIIRR